MTSEPLRRGAFVQTELGLGRMLAEANQDGVTVRFFRGPTNNPYVDRVFDRGSVNPAALAAHTRVYVNDGTRWRIGRVEGPHPKRKDDWLIAFPNSEGAVLPAHAFDVRWSQPVADPYEFLASVGGDSPYVY